MMDRKILIGIVVLICIAGGAVAQTALNVGTASGAAAGGIRASDDIHSVKSHTSAIPTGGDITIGEGFSAYNTNAAGVYSSYHLRTRTSSSAQAIVGLEWKANYQGDLFIILRTAAGVSTERFRLSNAGDVSIDGGLTTGSGGDITLGTSGDLTVGSAGNVDISDGYLCVENAGGADCSGTTDGFVYADDYIEHSEDLPDEGLAAVLEMENNPDGTLNHSSFGSCYISSETDGRLSEGISTSCQLKVLIKTVQELSAELCRKDNTYYWCVVVTP